MGHIERIGVVIPAYNASAWLPRTIDSVFRADDPERLEVIVVDDGSTDRTADVVADYAAASGSVRLLRQRNAGPSTARNAGYLSLAPSIDAVVFLDADDELTPGGVRVLREYLDRYPEREVAYGSATFIDAASRPTHPGAAERIHQTRFRWDGTRFVLCRADEPTGFESFAVNNCIITPAQALIRRPLIERTGLFDVELCSCEDWHFWMRASLEASVWPVDHTTVRYRDHGGNQLSKNHDLMHRCVCNAFAKVLEELSPPERESFLRCRLFALQRDATMWAGWGMESLGRFDVTSAAFQFGKAVASQARFAFESLRARVLPAH